MKSFLLLSLLVLAVAFAGIISQSGHGNWISYLSVVPLVLWVLVLLYHAVLGTLGDTLRKW